MNGIFNMESEQPTVMTGSPNESTRSWTNPKFLAKNEFQVDGFRKCRIRFIKQDKWIGIDGKVSVLRTEFEVSANGIIVAALTGQISEI